MIAVEQLMEGMSVSNPPKILETYLFCSPAMDGNFRCLPKAGGYYDQDVSDLQFFKIIEERIRDIRKRQEKK